MTYHAYELAREGAYDLGVDLNRQKMRRRLNADLKIPGGVKRISVGTVKGRSAEEALDAIRDNKWITRNEE